MGVRSGHCRRDDLRGTRPDQVGGELRGESRGVGEPICPLCRLRGNTGNITQQMNITKHTSTLHYDNKRHYMALEHRREEFSTFVIVFDTHMLSTIQPKGS